VGMLIRQRWPAADCQADMLGRAHTHVAMAATGEIRRS
jgi:hypothetical protein